MSENNKLVDVLFKVLSAGLLPAAMWINALSVDVAVLKAHVASNTERIVALETDLKESNRKIQANEVGLGELTKMLEFVRELLTEIRDAR